MAQADKTFLMVAGGIFIFLGIIAIVWDRYEKGKYLGTISHHFDTREFLTGWPERPQFGALKIGGWIAIIVGIVMLGWGLIVHIWG